MPLLPERALDEARALVEHTTLGPSLVSARTRRRAIAAYLAEHWSVDHWDVVREERGVLPMTTHRFPFTDIERAFDIMSSKQDGIIKPLITF